MKAVLCKVFFGVAVLAFGISGVALQPDAAFAQSANLPAQSVKPAGTTFNRAQSLDWLSSSAFAVGRWDGTISLFRPPRSDEFGPVILQATASPSGRGIEMVAAVDAATLLSSDGPGHLSLWAIPASGPMTLKASLPYDPKVGTANSALPLAIKGEAFIVSGHENGHVIVWKTGSAGEVAPLKTIDLRSKAPIPSPFPLHNIRSLVHWKDNVVISGSEDGDIVGIAVPDGTEVFRIRYNPTAKRGINNLAIGGNWLLLSNCSVGSADKNIWLYDLATGQPVLSDSENLALDTLRSQTFNFGVSLKTRGNVQTFYSSTEEGLLWEGRVEGGQLIVSGVTKVASEGGAILRLAPDAGLLAAAAYQIWLFKPE